MDMTRTIHFASYPAISPKRPELSQAGRTVLVTGGGAGIGFSISSGFAKAGAKHIIIVGRRVHVLEKAKRELLEIGGSGLQVSAMSCDISDPEAIEHLWKQLKQNGVEVDVLVLNAAATHLQDPELDQNDIVASIWRSFQENVHSSLIFFDRFHRQGTKKSKVLISVNSASAHIRPVMSGQFGYSSSKAGLGALMQCLADRFDPEELQIISYHPGGVLTEASRSIGAEKFPYPWNDGELPGDFAVWAASAEARFLHGRYLWCQWDVEELIQQKEKFLQDPTYCQIGLQGPTPVTLEKMFTGMQEAATKMNRSFAPVG